MINLSAPQHAEHGASSAYRWMACPGSIKACRGIADEPSKYAEEGTTAHLLAERCLKEGQDPLEYVDRRIFERGPIDGDMAEHVAVYVNAVREAVGDEGELLIEQRIDLGGWLGVPVAMFGTVDSAARPAGGNTLVITDLKYGQGVPVEAISNPQLRYYGLGAMIAMDWPSEIQAVTVRIVQPRCPHPDGPIRSETIDVVDLMMWAEELRAAVEATLADDAPLVPGKHCQLCPAKAQCPAMREHALELAKSDFQPIAEPAAARAQLEELSPDELSDLLDKADIAEKWIAAFRAYAHERLEAGDHIPNWKLVKKRATRKWLDADDAAVFLMTECDLSEDRIYNKSLRSPAQVEKCLPKANRGFIADLTVKESSGTTMARDSDARPALAAGPSADFTVIQE